MVPILPQIPEKSTLGNSPTGGVRESLADILLASGDVKAWELLKTCREDGRGWIGTCQQCGLEIHHVKSCSLRICPDCAARRAAILSEQLKPMVLRAIKSSEFPYPLKHIVLTTNICLLDYLGYDPGGNRVDVGSLAILGKKIADLETKIRLMFQDKFGGLDGFGGAVSAEFGPGGFMLHFHILGVMPWWKHSEISEKWQEVSAGAGAVVWVEAVKGTFTEQMNRVDYVCKEVSAGIGSKESHIADTTNNVRIEEFITAHSQAPLIAGIHFALKGHRRFRTFGSLYGHIEDQEKTLACPECGGFLFWQTELEWCAQNLDRGLLDLKKANKFPTGVDPGGGYKQGDLLDGWRDRLDTAKQSRN